MPLGIGRENAKAFSGIVDLVSRGKADGTCAGPGGIALIGEIAGEEKIAEPRERRMGHRFTVKA
jgi:hypothetical protein